MRAVKAGVVYFVLMFAVGWILGIRELWAVPHFGRVEATVVEAILMLIAMVVAARWAIRRFEVPHTFASTLSMGLISIGLLFPAEIAGIVWVRRLSVQEYTASLVTIPRNISLGLFLLFTAIPIVVGRLIPGNHPAKAVMGDCQAATAGISRCFQCQGSSSCSCEAG